MKKATEIVTFLMLVSVILILGISLCYIDEMDFPKLLKDLALVNITISIGLGTLLIAMPFTLEIKMRIFIDILYIISTSILSLLISNLYPHIDFLSQFELWLLEIIYLSVIGLSVVGILVSSLYLSTKKDSYE